jgi:hypothetical protein
MNKEYVFLGRMQPKTRDYIKNLERENRMLEHNWNELKRVLNGLLEDENDFYSVMRIRDLLKIIKQLEEGGNNE